MALIEAMPRIIAESVKPIENIDGIKILHVEGLNGHGGANGVGDGISSGGIADQAVSAALRFRSQAPLIDSLMKELGINGSDLSGLAAAAQIDGLGAIANGQDNGQEIGKSVTAPAKATKQSA